MPTVPQPIPIADATTRVLRGLGLAFAAFAALVSACIVLVQADHVPGIDFYQFWVVGTELQKSGATPFYSDEQRAKLGQSWLTRAKKSRGRILEAASFRPQLETYSTPVLYSFFAALSTGEYERDHRRYSLLCLITASLAIGCVCRMFDYSWTRTLLAIAFFLGLYTPLQCDVGVTNVNQLQLGGLVLYLWTQGRRDLRLANYLGGAVLGLLLAFKPNLAFSISTLFLTWAFQLQWDRLRQQTIGMLAAIAVAVAASVWTFQSVSCWLDWVQSLQALMGVATYRVDEGNYGLARLMEEATGRRVSTLLLAGLAGIALCAAVRGLKGKSTVDRRQVVENDLLAISLGTIVMLLSARLVWQHYFVLLIPTVNYCLRPRTAVETGRRPVAGRIALALAALFLIARVPPLLALALPEAWARALPGPAGQAVCISLGTLLIFGLVIGELNTLRREPDPVRCENPQAVPGLT